MLKKILYTTLILCSILVISNICYATDVLMDLNDNSITMSDNTLYLENQDNIDSDLDYTEPSVSTTTDYEDSAELSISNMINIILIVVGVVLILLGIAIIIKLK